MALTENQKHLQREQFYKNGLYLPSRTIVFGTNAFKEDSEITDMDFTDFVKSLHLLENTRNESALDESENLIKIILLTVGGDIYLGLAMYDIIKACKSPVEIRAIGQCMSAGTIVLQAGDYRYAYPTTTFMIHKGTIDLGETSVTDAAITGEETARLVEKMIDIYQETMSISRKAIEQMLDRDTFMDVAKAKKVGLIDGFKNGFD